MQESKQIRTGHTLLAPYCAGVFGKMRPMILDIEFEVGAVQNGISVKVLSLTGTETDGKVYDMIHLMEDGDGEGIDNDLMTGIIGNEKQWNSRKKWW